MNGYYLSLDDENFLDLIIDELDKYHSQNETSLCVSWFCSCSCWLLNILDRENWWEIYFVFVAFCFFHLWHQDIDCYCIKFDRKIIRIYSVFPWEKRKIHDEQLFVSNHNWWTKQICTKSSFACCLSSSLDANSSNLFVVLEQRHLLQPTISTMNHRPSQDYALFIFQ